MELVVNRIRDSLLVLSKQLRGSTTKGFVLCALVPILMLSATTPASGMQPSKTYSSCKAVWKKYPNGVAESRQAARDAMDLGYERPTINKSVYLANYKRLDDDYLGVICPSMSEEALGEFLLNSIEQDICEGLDVIGRPMNERPSYCQQRR